MRDEAIILRRLLAVIGGLLTILVGAYFLWPTAIGRVSPDRDFMGLWSAGRLALQGQGASAYSEAAAWPIQARHGASNWIPFRGAPPMLLLLAAFASLPFAVAAPVWIAATYSVWLAAARRLLPGGFWVIATYPGVLMNAVMGQTGYVTASLFVGAVLTLETRPFLAGALLGGLVVKPQLALLVPVALAAGRQWRAFAGAAVSALSLLLLAVIVFGPAAITGFLDGSRGGLAFLGKPPPVQMLLMPTVYAFSDRLTEPSLAAAIQAVVSLLMVALIWWTWSRPIEALAKWSLLAIATVLTTPYLYSYDLVLLIVPVAWLMQRAMTSWRMRIFVTVFYWSPFLTTFFLFIHVNLMVVLLVAVLALSLWTLRNDLGWSHRAVCEGCDRGLRMRDMTEGDRGTRAVSEGAYALAAAAGAMLLASFPLLLRADFFLNDDFRFYFMPIYGEVARLTSAGHLPFVTDRLWQGGAILPEYQAGVLNPFCFLLIQVIGRLSDYALGAAMYSIAHIGVFAAGVYLLCGALGVDRKLRLVAAIAAPTSEWIFYWGAINWIPFLVSLSWAPWTWWALLQTNRSPRWIGVASVCVALVLLSGCPFTDLALLISVLVAAAGIVLRARKFDLLRAPLLALVLGGMLSAPALTPLLPYLEFTARQPSSWGWQADALALLGVSTPFIAKNWNGFHRPLVFLPMLQAAWFVVPAIANYNWRRKVELAPAVLSSFAIIVGLLSLTPGFWMFRWMFRMLPYYQLAAILLAVVCLSERSQQARAWASPAALTWLALATWLAMWQSPQVIAFNLAFGSLAILACLMAEQVQRKRPATIWAYLIASHALIFGLVAFTYVSSAERYPDNSHPYHVAPQERAALTRYSIFSADQLALGPQFFETYRPANLSLDGAGTSIQGYSPFQFASYRGALCADSQFGATFCDDVVERLSRPAPPTDASLLDLARVDEVSIAERGVADRFAATHTGWRRDSLPGGGSRFRRMAAYRVQPPVSWTSPGVEARTIDQSPSRTRFMVTNGFSRPGRLVLARAWYPGWSAKLAGRTLPVIALEGIFVSVEIPPHATGVLETSYVPAGLGVGLLLAGIGLAGGVGLALWPYGNDRKSSNAVAGRRPPEPSPQTA